MLQKHLIPPAVIDCVEGMTNKNFNVNTRNNYEDRVRAIKEYCEQELNKKNFNKKVR
jgi:hypothetical protein